MKMRLMRSRHAGVDGYWGHGKNNGAQASLWSCEIWNKHLFPVKRKRLPYRKIANRGACVYFGSHPISGHTATPPRYWLNPFPSCNTMAITSMQSFHLRSSSVFIRFPPEIRQQFFFFPFKSTRDFWGYPQRRTYPVIGLGGLLKSMDCDTAYTDVSVDRMAWLRSDNPLYAFSVWVYACGCV